MRLLEPISFKITAKLVSSWTCGVDVVNDIQDGVERQIKAETIVTFGHF
jgi:hypothetical protein